MLDRYTDEQLHETAGIDRSDKGQHRIGEYWPEYIRSVYEQSVKDKHLLTPANIVREVHRHALIDLRHEEGDYPHQATIYRILKPLVARQKRRIRNPGAGSWMSVETRDGKLLKADFSNQIVQCDRTKLDVRIVDEDGNLLNISPEDGGAERAEKEARLTIEDVDKILAAYFCDDYNHQPYPKDPRDTRYEKWLRGMGGKLPEQLNERELDILLMKEEQRVVQAYGSIFFETLTYRCEELKPFVGQYVTVNYDPDHVLTLYAYIQATGDRSGEFIGCAHAINMDIQDSSLYELKQLNKENR
ncbi:MULTISPECIES: Mu transposase C-terminal domain-containing protein [unclassified Chamaesiphon]|uniref:Mu transposase C-terminal domain-containing protein n=1 Tax=unclassified Chamaesiphon TaxID=2620921 RepID=UPI00286BA69F|nr:MULTISPECIES: Mu transposase C-terminal domain-containing protein [unclassified Chamaesiphon]